MGVPGCYKFLQTCIGRYRTMAAKLENDQGPVSLTFFPSQFKFDENFVLLSPRLHYRDRYKILYMARQLCCRGMCKNLLPSDGQQRSYGKAKFPSYLNCGQKTVSETGPCVVEIVSWHCCQQNSLCGL